MSVTQQNRSVELTTPLGPDVLLIRSLSGTERLGRLFEYELELVSEDNNITLESILGQNVTVHLRHTEGGERHVNGFVTRFTYLGANDGYGWYRATVRPWLWFLTRRADVRIFQEKTVPDIIKEVFRERGFSDFDERLSGSYTPWDYCVQYRETDFNFVSRLMEQEGIYYFFEHEDGKHTLVLADAYSAHNTVSGYEEVPYYPPDERGLRERDHISRWTFTGQVKPGEYTLNDYDFEAPNKNLVSNLSSPAGHEQHADYEFYDYPGEYTESSDGNHYVRTRLEELKAQYHWQRGEGDAHGLACGALFTLVNYPRDDQNIEYLLVATTLNVQSDPFESTATAGAGLNVFTVTFTAMDAQIPYRTARRTPKPVVQGPQTAVVVGKSGEEIWTDQYGRVKVQFHWDRLGEKDENSSCWVRVSQVWAGDNWGAIHIPRMGQEVIVSFLEGDPDQPIITGRVYNGDNMPPYGLPENQTQSGIKSRSSKGGSSGNYNEIRFEDKMDEEQLLIHAERNQDIEVEADETHWVGNDRTKTIDHDETNHIKNDRTETVDNNEDITIGNNRTESVGAEETIDIGTNRTESVGANEDITIGVNRTTQVGANETIDIGANRTMTVGAIENITVSGGRVEQVSGMLSQTVNGPYTINVNGPFAVTASGGWSLTAPAGTRTIDNMFDSIGGFLKRTFGFKSDVSNSTYQATGVAIGQTAEKIETTGQAFCATGTNMETKGINMSFTGLACDQIGVEIKTESLHVIT